MQRILVGYDGSEPSRKALMQAASLAGRFACPLTVLTAASDRLVLDGGTVTVNPDEPAGRQVAGHGAILARAYGADPVEVRTSLDAADEALIAEAAHGYDLMVVGHRSRGVLAELLLGSTAKHVVDRAHCSVLVVR